MLGLLLGICMLTMPETVWEYSHPFPTMPETVQEYIERGRESAEKIKTKSKPNQNLVKTDEAEILQPETAESGYNDPEKQEIEDVTTKSGYKFYGTMELTAYIETGNACADGVYPSVGYTAACNDPNLWHRWVYIEGVGARYIHDTGGMASDVIDVYVGDYNSAIQFGRQTANVYVME